LCLCKDEEKTLDIIKNQGYRELKLYPNTKLTSGFSPLCKYLLLLPGEYGKRVGDKVDPIRNIEDDSDSYQMKTENGDKLVPKVALLKFRNWKARVVMNAYISLLKIFYPSKMAPQSKV
jgi:hypothetical protein